MTAGPKAAVDGASLPPAARSAGAWHPATYIHHFPRRCSLMRRCAPLGETKQVSATVAHCDLDGQFVCSTDVCISSRVWSDHPVQLRRRLVLNRIDGWRVPAGFQAVHGDIGRDSEEPVREH